MDGAQEVMAAVQARATALAAGDGERLDRLLHEQFSWTTHTGETYDRVEYIRRNTEGETVWRSQTLTATHVVTVGDTAVVTAEVSDVIHRDNRDEVFRMPTTQVWIRRQGAWRCLAGHAGPLRA